MNLTTATRLAFLIFAVAVCVTFLVVHIATRALT